MLQGKGSSDANANNKELIIGVSVAVVLLSLGVLKILLHSPQAPEVVAKPQAEAAAFASEHVSTTMKVREKLESQKREKALAAITEHQNAITGNWGAEDTPDRLMAVGNLYQYRLGDYYSAIHSYNTFIENYPAHRRTAQAYIEVAACYERLGDETQARYVYREMVEFLDPSLEHVAYARRKLERE